MWIDPGMRDYYVEPFVQTYDRFLRANRVAEGVAAYSSPLPHVLILTAIVVGVATTAVGLALVVRIHEAYGSAEEDHIHAEDLAQDEALLDADATREDQAGR